MPAKVGQPPAIPLTGWADRQIQGLATATGFGQLAQLTGAGLLGERAALNNFRIATDVSAGGGCRLYQTANGWLALSLSRPDDRALLPALFGDASLDPDDDGALAAYMAEGDAQALAAHGAELGLAIAAESEELTSPAWETICHGQHARRAEGQRPIVIDLSALWAGPLATHLLQLAGATVLKVESLSRPDAMRAGDPALFDLLNQNKASIALDIRTPEGCAALISLIRKADIVLEASRPRALLQLGIDADALIAETPGLVWISITGHGVRGPSANRIGFGDDCGVAGGLTAKLREASGVSAFVGDAIADPLTGITAARLAWNQRAKGDGGRIVLSMSGIIATALAEEEARDAAELDQTLRAWAAAQGQPFPPAPALAPSRTSGTARAFGADSSQWLPC